jgi:Domain of unknown function (DUF1330)
MMKPYYTVALSMLVGAGLGGAAIQALRAQAKPPIYVVAEIDVTNPDAYPTDYATKMQALIKSHGGRQLAIGGIGGECKRLDGARGHAAKASRRASLA